MDTDIRPAVSAALARFSHDQHLFELDWPVFERFEGDEAVCDDFRFTFDCFCPEAFLDMPTLLGEPMALRRRLVEGSLRHRHGHGHGTRVARVFSGQESYLTRLPYLIVDAETLEAPHHGTTRDEPGFRSGHKTRVTTADVALDGVRSGGMVMGGASNGDPNRCKDEASDLVMYRVAPGPEGLTTVTITQTQRKGRSRRATTSSLGLS